MIHPEIDDDTILDVAGVARLFRVSASGVYYMVHRGAIQPHDPSHGWRLQFRMGDIRPALEKKATEWDPDLITQVEAAKILGVAPSAVYRMVQRGTLDSVPIRQNRRPVRRQQVKELVKARGRVAGEGVKQ